MFIDKDNRQLWNCSAWSIFQFLCPQTWNNLSPTDNADVRHCSVCKEKVYLCSTPENLVNLGRSGKCVAILPSHARSITHGYLGRPSRSSQLLADRVTNARRFWDAVAELGRRSAIQEYFDDVSTRETWPTKGFSYIVIDVGKQTSYAMLICNGHLDQTQIVPDGIFAFGEAIMSQLKKSIGVEVGEQTAAYLLKETLIACRDGEIGSVTISAIDRENGIPRKYVVSHNEIRLAIKGCLDTLSKAVMGMLQNGDSNFLYLTGDLCRDGLDAELAKLIGLPVARPAVTAHDQVIRGLSNAMDRFNSEMPRLDMGRVK